MRRSRPLYQQVRERLLDRISSGELKVGDRLEPEVELAVAYNVSRATMRNAIRDLVQEGLLTRRPGVGTMIIRSAPEMSSSNLDPLLEGLAAGHEDAQLLVLDSQVIQPTEAIAGQLRLEADEKVLHVFRICKIDSVTAAVSHTYLPARLGISAAEARVAPFYDLLERTYRNPISYGHDSVGTAGAAGETAKLLGVRAGTPVLTINRVSFDGSGIPLEYTDVTFHSDYYRYEVTLPRNINVF
jgi:DNA-binding GntR family transcriptional regulator